MPEKITTEVLNVRDTSDGKTVEVEVTRLAPTVTDMLAQERARARAMAAVGWADTVYEVFQRLRDGDVDLSRLTSVKSVSNVSNDGIGVRERYTVKVNR